MVNRHLLTDIDLEPSTEKLLEPSRITLKYDNILENEGYETDMKLDCNLEPFEMKLGYREVDFFN